MSVTPRHDPETNTYTVDWPGRPEGPLPRFDTFEEARTFAQLVKATQAQRGAEERTPAHQPQAAQQVKAIPVDSLGTPARNRLPDLALRRHSVSIMLIPESIRHEDDAPHYDIRLEQRRRRRR